MTLNTIAEKPPLCQGGVALPLPNIPPDLILSDKDHSALIELAQKLPPGDFQQLIEGYRIAQQKSGKSVAQLKAEATCIEKNSNILPSTQDRKRLYAYFIQTRNNRARKKGRLEKGLKHLPKVAGWWRAVIKTKATYSLATEGDKQATLLKAKAFFGWQQGDWTLNTWWGRIPNQALWEYAMADTGEYGLDHNPVYFARCLHTAATLWRRFPVPKLWCEVVKHAHRFKNLSRNVLLCLLTAMMKALSKTGASFGEWVLRFIAFPDGKIPDYFTNRARASPLFYASSTSRGSG